MNVLFGIYYFFKNKNDSIFGRIEVLILLLELVLY